MPAWRLFNGGSRLSLGRKWEQESRVAAGWWIVSGDKKLSHGKKWCNRDAWNHIPGREEGSFYFSYLFIYLFISPSSATNLLSGDWKQWCHFLANGPFRQINSPPTWRSTTLSGREEDSVRSRSTQFVGKQVNCELSAKCLSETKKSANIQWGSFLYLWPVASWKRHLGKQRK